MTLSKDEKYQALLNKDPDYDGLFFAAIKTTGIFCRPICTARKPKRENVEFYNSAHDAILSGCRPCKICKPQFHIQTAPIEITELLSLIEDNPAQRITDQNLRERGLEPNTIRRWFLKHHQMTFQAFQRLIRINAALKKIQAGESIIDTAYNSGFESLSGFNDSFKLIFGVTPSRAKLQKNVYLNRIETPIGTMFAGASDKGLCLLEFTDRRMLETEFKNLVVKAGATFIKGENSFIKQVKVELDEYFKGERKRFTTQLDMHGTEFQKKVWEILIDIPYGTTRSYKDQAKYLNNPTAVRAIANANGMNQMSIIIPCHRVIGSDGKLVGYGGGLWRKKWLLDFEKHNY